jgi:ribonuclease HI
VLICVNFQKEWLFQRQNSFEFITIVNTNSLGLKMKKNTAETRKYRLDMNEKILNSGFRDFNKFFALDNKAYVSGALPAKVKELMGLVGSMVLRCNDCIFYHIDRSIAEGASREELLESFNIALIVGGSIVIPHLRYAFDVMDEIYKEKKAEK